MTNEQKFAEDMTRIRVNDKEQSFIAGIFLGAILAIAVLVTTVVVSDIIS